MQLIRKQQAVEFRNGDHCVAREYPAADEDINGAVVELSGRYPDQGYVVNDVCKELVFVVDGEGLLHTRADDGSVQLAAGDLVLLLPDEQYFFDGRMTLFVSSSPAWYPGQHRSADGPTTQPSDL